MESERERERALFIWESSHHQLSSSSSEAATKSRAAELNCIASLHQQPKAGLVRETGLINSEIPRVMQPMPPSSLSPKLHYADRGPPPSTLVDIRATEQRRRTKKRTNGNTTLSVDKCQLVLARSTQDAPGVGSSFVSGWEKVMRSPLRVVLKAQLHKLLE